MGLSEAKRSTHYFYLFKITEYKSGSQSKSFTLVKYWTNNNLFYYFIFDSSNSAYAGATVGPGMSGGSVTTSNGGVSTIESAKRGHPLKSFSVPGPPPTGGQTPINKHSKFLHIFLLLLKTNFSKYN